MQFDWFTFSAQIINFVILLFLLRRFLYRPVLKAMETRQEQIIAQFSEAESQAKEAHREAELFHKKRKDLEEQKAALLNDAKSDAQQQRKEMLAQARAEVNERREGWHSRLEHDQATYLDELRQRTSKQVFSIARHALSDLANVPLEQQIVTVFCERLRQLDGYELEILNQALQNSRGQVTVRTAYSLEEPQREIVRNQLHELFQNGHLIHAQNSHAEDTPTLQIAFEEAADLACGIELRAFGHVIAWTLDDYIHGLEEQVASSFHVDGFQTVG